MAIPLRWIVGFCILFFLVLWGRLFQLQILEGAEYRQRSEANAIRVVEEDLGRTVFYDRRGRVLVENRPAYAVTLIPYEAYRHPEIITALAPILSLTEDELKEVLYKNGTRYYQPVKVARDIDFTTYAAIRARGLDLPGVNIVFDPKRYYPNKLAPHTLGYIAEISETELKKHPNRKMGDNIGKSGIEKGYEELVSGAKGYRYMLVNAYGQLTGELKDKYIPPAKNGKLYLTLDQDLQMIAEQALEGKRGAAVALDPNTGEVLVLASAPKYDPEMFSGVLRTADWAALNNDPEVPLLHRATQSGYPLASTFKMCTLTAALEEGIITPSYRDYCTGSYTLGRVYNCFKRSGHGWLTPVEAIERSCDAFFYKLGHRLGVERLTKYMYMYGFGARTGIDIENEISGNVPDVNYLNKRYGAGKWSLGLVINLSIGQGESLATPLQLAQYCGILACAGTKAKPHVFKELINTDGTIIRYKPEISHVNISPETFDLVRTGMLGVFEGPGGTAWWLKSNRWHMAGKTGTAQNPHGEDHALFIGFAPYDHPLIAVAVVVENVGFGSTHAAPIAVSIMSKYLEVMGVPEISSSQQVAEKRMAPVDGGD